MRKATRLTLVVIGLLCFAFSGPAFAYLHPVHSRFLQRNPAWHVDGMNVCQDVGSKPVMALDSGGTRSHLVCAGEPPRKEEGKELLTAEQARAALLALIDSLPEDNDLKRKRDAVAKSEVVLEARDPHIVHFDVVECDLLAATFYAVFPLNRAWTAEFVGLFEKTRTGAWRAVVTWSGHTEEYIPASPGR